MAPPFSMLKILGIETSCDETSVAVVSESDGRFFVEKNLITSQIDLHKITGGVVPEVAARAHVEALFPLLLEAGVARDGSGIDAIAVTAGPGLIPALRIGVEAAKVLAYAWDKPLVAVNHLEGHIYSAWLGQWQPTFPALVLLVSGGHTELILMREHGKYKTLGTTRDDAAGEAFDKVAKLLGLSYPGGPEISRLAKEGNKEAIAFPRPMLESGDMDFSFSGLKTAVRVYLDASCAKGASIADICASFQEAVVDTLVTKTMRAVSEYHPASLILAGGVSANASLRERLTNSAHENHLPFFLPPLSYTTDNAAMIAVAGLFALQRKQFANPIILEADPHISF